MVLTITSPLSYPRAYGSVSNIRDALKRKILNSLVSVCSLLLIVTTSFATAEYAVPGVAIPQLGTLHSPTIPMTVSGLHSRQSSAKHCRSLNTGVIQAFFKKVLSPDPYLRFSRSSLAPMEL